MKRIETIYQATMRALFVLIALPTFTLAGMKLDSTLQVDSEQAFKFIALFVTAFAGGISSVFVKTSFDTNMNHPNAAKIWVGTCLGTTSGLLALEQLSFGLFSILLPVFVIASLGAPIMVFYLMWLSNEETQAEIKEKIKEKVGMKK